MRVRSAAPDPSNLGTRSTAASGHSCPARLGRAVHTARLTQPPSESGNADKTPFSAALSQQALTTDGRRLFFFFFKGEGTFPP